MLRSRLVGVAAVAAALAASACGSTSNGGSGGTTGSDGGGDIVVAMLQPLSGDAAVVGQSGQHGAQLAVDQFNAAGGLKGRHIKLEVADSAGQVATGTNAWAKLRADKPVALLGPNFSAVALALVPNMARDHVPMLAGALTPALTQSKSPWVFRIRSSDAVGATDLVDYAVNTLHLQQFGVVNETSDYGQGGATAVVAALKAHGITPAQTETFNTGANDLTSQILAIKNLPAVIYWGSQSPAALFAKQAKQLGYNGVILGSNAYTDASVLQLAGPAAEGVYSVVNFVPTGSDAKVTTFVSAFKQKYGSAPDSYAASYYDTVNLLVTAMKQGGADAQKIADALKTVSYDGLTARFQYHDNGEMAGGQEITKVENGAPVVLERAS